MELSKLLVNQLIYIKSKRQLKVINRCEFEIDEIRTLPQDTVELEGEDMELFERLMNNLNDCDDVDQIYHNVANYDEGE